MHNLSIADRRDLKDNPLHDNKDIHERLHEITCKVDRVEKKGYNDFNKYSYVRAVDVIREVKKLLIQEGVTLTFEELECHNEKIGDNIHCYLKVKATFSCVESPSDKKEIVYFSQGTDRLDKAIFKAKTNGLKYLFIQEFLIDSDEVLVDAESDAPHLENNKPSGQTIVTQHQSPRHQLQPQYRADENNDLRWSKPRTQRGNKKITPNQLGYIMKMQNNIGEIWYEYDELIKFSSKEASDLIGELKKRII